MQIRQDVFRLNGGSDVASRQTPSQRVASLSAARLRSAGAGSGLEINRRSTHRAHLSVDTYSQTAAATAAAEEGK